MKATDHMYKVNMHTVRSLEHMESTSSKERVGVHKPNPITTTHT